MLTSVNQKIVDATKQTQWSSLIKLNCFENVFEIIMASLMNSVQLTNISDTLLYDIHHLTTAADLSKLQALYKFSNI